MPLTESEHECYGPWYVVTDSSGVLWVGESREEAFTFAARNRAVAPTVTIWKPRINGGSAAFAEWKVSRCSFEVEMEWDLVECEWTGRRWQDD